MGIDRPVVNGDGRTVVVGGLSASVEGSDSDLDGSVFGEPVLAVEEAADSSVVGCRDTITIVDCLPAFVDLSADVEGVSAVDVDGVEAVDACLDESFVVLGCSVVFTVGLVVSAEVSIDTVGSSGFVHPRESIEDDSDLVSPIDQSFVVSLIHFRELSRRMKIPGA